MMRSVYVDERYEGVIEDVQEVEVTPTLFARTWVSFTSLFSGFTTVEVPRAQPIAYAPEFTQHRVAGIPFSTGNTYQAYYLYSIREIDVYPHDTARRVLRGMNDAVAELRAAINEHELDDIDTRRAALREPLFNFYRNAYIVHGGIATASSSPPPDDLSQRIAEELAHIYYENLDLTLDDVKNCFRKHFSNLEHLSELSPDLIQKILHAKIDKGRMELRALLPTQNILDVALAELKQALQPNIFMRMIHNTLQFFRIKMGYSIAVGGNSPKGPDEPHMQNPSVSSGGNDDPNDTYRKVVAKTLDKYISWWKISWFGHHHDQRARHLKAEILDPRTSVEKIQGLLWLQEELITPANYDANNDWIRGVPMVAFTDAAIEAKWGNPSQVVHHTQLLSQSGFFKVLEEALQVDPENPVYQPDRSSCFGNV